MAEPSDLTLRLDEIKNLDFKPKCGEPGCQIDADFAYKSRCKAGPHEWLLCCKGHKDLIDRRAMAQRWHCVKHEVTLPMPPMIWRAL